MKNLYYSEKFIMVTEDCYFIILPLFCFTEDFNISLLEFLGEYCRPKRRLGTHCECDIYLLEFNTDQNSKNRKIIVPFLYPYVDKALSFNHIFELYLYVHNVNSIYLCIKKK
jgi:hypothetical protein